MSANHFSLAVLRTLLRLYYSARKGPRTDSARANTVL